METPNNEMPPTGYSFPPPNPTWSPYDPAPKKGRMVRVGGGAIAGLAIGALAIGGLGFGTGLLIGTRTSEIPAMAFGTGIEEDDEQWESEGPFGGRGQGDLGGEAWGPMGGAGVELQDLMLQYMDGSITEDEMLARMQELFGDAFTEEDLRELDEMLGGATEEGISS